MATQTVTSLPDQEFEELSELIERADSVELKLTVPLSDRSRAGQALGVDPSTARSGRSTSSTRRIWRSTREASSSGPVACRGAATTRS